jgi:hypothetical protein
MTKEVTRKTAPLELAATLYSSNCEMFRLVQDKWGKSISFTLDSFTLRFKEVTISPIHNSLICEYDNHPGFGGQDGSFFPL